MFTTPCFIKKNTKELRDKLKELGYEELKPFCSLLDTFDAIVTIDGRLFGKNLYAGLRSEEWAKELRVDCGTNDNLFLSISALNDENDYMQWFTNGAEWILCDRQDWMDMYSCLCSGKGKEYMEHLDMFHKATVEELIEYFK